ncbi:MAG: hypothetical protein ABFS12_01205 [Bacteroidota bacterium]
MFFTASEIYSRGRNGYPFWVFNNLGGFVGLESNYYYLGTTLKTGFTEKQKTTQFNGLLSLDTESYILHPNFLQLGLGVLLRPGTRSDNFIVAPDQANITTAERVNFRADLFRQRVLNSNFYFNYDHSFIRRDFATNIENFRKNLGAGVNFRNPIVNFNFNYDYDDWLQDEIELDRFYASTRHNFRAQAHQNYGRNFTNKLTTSYTDFVREYSYNDLLIANKIFDANVNTRVSLTAPISINYYSLILFNKQHGYDRRDKFQILQNVSSPLTSTLTFNGSYNYNHFKVDQISSNTNSVDLGLNHKLYQSLRSHINFRFSDYDQTFYSQKDNTFEAGVNYTKTIYVGRLNLSYTYSRFGRSTESLSNVLSIFNEPHQLNDGSVELLINPDVFVNSIVVTDAAGIIVYQENFDYEIIERENYTEIRRILGGQIPNGGRVLVNYDHFRNSSYEYNSNNHRFFAGVSFLNNFIEVSYSGTEMNFDNLYNVDYVVLKLISQRIAALSFNFWGFSTGIEFDTFKSNIVPYESQRFFANYSEMISRSITLSLSSNYKSIYLTASRERQIFKDAVGRLLFMISPSSKLLFEGSYRSQRGYGLDLDLLKLKTEFQLTFRAIQLAIGAEAFDRTFIQEQRQFFNGYISIQRNF